MDVFFDAVRRQVELVPPVVRHPGVEAVAERAEHEVAELVVRHVQHFEPLEKRRREQVDAACRVAGRDPAEVARTLALFVAFPGAQGRELGDLSEPEVDPIDGEPSAVAAALRAFAAEGVAHVQLVLDPITVESIGALQPALALLDA